MLNVILASAVGLTLQWESDCQQLVSAARTLAENDVGILVTTRPGWLPRPVYSLAYKLGVSQRPALAELYVHIAKDGQVSIQGKEFTVEAAKERIKELRSEIIKVTGMHNVHIMFVVPNDYKTGRKTAAHWELMRFTYAEFDSGSAIREDQLKARKNNLDPRSMLCRSDG